MMEVLLNAIWLWVAIAAFGYWHVVGHSGTSPLLPRGRFNIALALACALILLFPVISLTDDLHAAQTVMEDSSRAVMKARVAAKACLRSSGPVLLPPLAKPTANSRVLPPEVIPFEACLPCLVLISRCEGRSPPRRTT